MNPDSIKDIVVHADKVVTWCFYLTGGSIVTLLGTIYIRPIGKKMKFSYLLFLLGWIFLGIAFKSASDLNAEGVTTFFPKNSESRFIDLIVQMQNDYSSLLHYYNLALYTFGAWLIIYLLWWIFSGSAKKA